MVWEVRSSQVGGSVLAAGAFDAFPETVDGPPQQRHKGVADVLAEEEIQNEVEAKVEELQIVSDGAEDLEVEVIPLVVPEGEGQDSSGDVGHEEGDNDGDEQQHQSSFHVVASFTHPSGHRRWRRRSCKT